jgi:hypothetical protein
VLEKSVAQGEQQFAGLHLLVVLHAVRSANDFGKHSLVFGAMAGETWIIGLLHQGFFRVEVNAREFDEAIEELAYLLAPAAVHEGEAQVVHGVHEDAVLVVHGANFDGAGVVPSEQRHMSLHKSLKEPSVDRGQRTTNVVGRR